MNNSLQQKKLIIYVCVTLLLIGGALLFVYYGLGTKIVKIPQIFQQIVGRIPVSIPTPAPVTPPITPTPTQSGTPSTLPIEQKLLQLTDFPIVSPSLMATGDRIMFYKKDGGDLFASDFDGRKREKISNLTIVGLLEALWSPRKDRAAITYLDDETLKTFLHIGTSSVIALTQNIQSSAWSPDGKSFAYVTPRGDRLDLVIADAAGKNQKTVFSTPVTDASIRWATSDKILFTTAPSGLAEGYSFVFFRAQGVFNRLLGPLFGLQILPSPDGARLLSSLTDLSGKNPVVSIRDAAGKLIFTTDIHTIADKCIWAGAKKLYCAVPKTIPRETLWPDDYLRGEINTSDRISALDLETKSQEELFGEEDNFDISNLIITKDEKTLFFVNRIDGTLWRLKLK